VGRRRLLSEGRVYEVKTILHFGEVATGHAARSGNSSEVNFSLGLLS
jgi:hypothetical protein